MTRFFAANSMEKTGPFQSHYGLSEFLRKMNVSAKIWKLNQCFLKKNPSVGAPAKRAGLGVFTQDVNNFQVLFKFYQRFGKRRCRDTEFTSSVRDASLKSISTASFSTVQTLIDTHL